VQKSILSVPSTCQIRSPLQLIISSFVFVMQAGWCQLGKKAHMLHKRPCPVPPVDGIDDDALDQQYRALPDVSSTTRYCRRPPQAMLAKHSVGQPLLRSVIAAAQCCSTQAAIAAAAM